MDFRTETEWMFSQSNKSPNRPLIIGNSLNESTSLIYENNTVNQTQIENHGFLLHQKHPIIYDIL